MNIIIKNYKKKKTLKFEQFVWGKKGKKIDKQRSSFVHLTVVWEKTLPFHANDKPPFHKA